MSNFLKCECPHCGEPIEHRSEGTEQTVSCPTCEKPVTLTAASTPTKLLSIVIPPAAVLTEPKVRKQTKTNLSKLTEETIRTRTKTGDTPLHRAARVGKIHELPRHLLQTELFLVQNYDWRKEPHRTPLHVAAMYGHLDQVPSEFLTKETLTILDKYGRTPLHEAVASGHLDKIPKEFLTPEFLSIPTQNYGDTILHFLAWRNQLAELPEGCMSDEMWNLENHHGQTVRQILENIDQHVPWLAAARREPATEKQKEKLRSFDYACPDGITKGQASDAIDECVRRFTPWEA
jgi:hypothetical protein